VMNGDGTFVPCLLSGCGMQSRFGQLGFPVQRARRHTSSSSFKACAPTPTKCPESIWFGLLNHTNQELCPKVVIEIWSSDVQTWEK
jgi:hypothetical protein